MTGGVQHEIDCDRLWRTMSGEQGNMELAARQRLAKRKCDPQGAAARSTSSRYQGLRVGFQPATRIVWPCALASILNRTPLLRTPHGTALLCLNRSANLAKRRSPKNGMVMTT